MDKSREYITRLFLTWLNERYGRSFAPSPVDDSLFEAREPDGSIIVAVYVLELSESTPEWQQRRDELVQRLDQAREGSYMLWIPPGGELPKEEPYASEWVTRVAFTASKLASGRVGEVRLPVRIALGKVRDEGGYASVTGGLGRYWTEISGRLHGSYYLDSRALNRFTRNEEQREELYAHIAAMSETLSTGDVVEIEHDDAWSVQRLPRGTAATGMTDGWAITGRPDDFNPNDGGAVRRVLRRKLADATPALVGYLGAVKVLLLAGGYDYMASENAGPSLRGFDPALTAPFDIIALASDAEVKALRVSRGLPFGIKEDAPGANSTPSS